ncbi:MAG: hypothetical protein GXY80_11450, partial [Syntrophorhabdus aromaticivorans]|nr:hypothetical protein [Syntrophorhabdus aromaticivorans]
ITARIYADVLLLTGYEIERPYPVNPPKRFSSAGDIMLRSSQGVNAIARSIAMANTSTHASIRFDP